MAKENVEQKMTQQFTDMLIERLNEINDDWQKPWVTNTAGMPRNFDGRYYNGINAFMLAMHSEKNGYELPVYMTFLKAKELGANIKKGEQGFPVYLYSFIVYDKEHKKISQSEFDKLPQEEKKKCQKIPFLRIHFVFNIQQTRYPELFPEKYQEMKDIIKGVKLNDEQNMRRVPELDYMLKEQSWLCPIEVKYSDQAFYSISKDEIVVPEKAQFNNGENFYSTLLHEMAHSTGKEDRLNRHFGGDFGSPEYGREELVAELTAAMVAMNMGISKTIKEDSLAYLKGWLINIKEEPKFIQSVITDVNRAISMITGHVFTQEVKDAIKQEAMDSINRKIEAASMNTEDFKLSRTVEPQSISINKYLRMNKETQNQELTIQQQNFEQITRKMQGKYKETPILLFRDGDNYKVYSEQAEVFNKITGVDITQNADFEKEVSFNASMLDTYLPKLVRADKRCAILDAGTLDVNPQQTNQMVSEQQQPEYGKKLEEDNPKLKMAVLDNGISFWQNGENDYGATLSTDRKLTVNYDANFTKENLDRIQELRDSDNLVVGEGDQRRLALNPIKMADRIFFDPKTNVAYAVSIENVGDKRMAVRTGDAQVVGDINKKTDLMKYPARQMPEEYTFTLSNVNTWMDKLHTIGTSGIKMDFLDEHKFFEVVGDMMAPDSPLSEQDKEQYTAIFRVKNNEIVGFGRKPEQVDALMKNPDMKPTAQLASFTLVGNRFKTAARQSGVELSDAQQMLQGTNIVHVKGIDNFKSAITEMRKMGVTPEPGLVNEINAMVRNAKKDNTLTDADLDNAQLYIMVNKGIATDSEPRINEQEYREENIPIFRYDGKNITLDRPQAEKIQQQPVQQQPNIVSPIVTNQKSENINLKSNNPQKNNVMEEKKQEEKPKTEKKQMQDGVNLYKSGDDYRMTKVEGGKVVGTRTPDARDLNDYFKAVKGKKGDEVKAAFTTLADKYFGPKAKDGIELHPLTSNKLIYVVQQFKGGEVTPAKAVSKADLQAFFEAVKGKGADVRNAELQKLADKYLSPEALKAAAEKSNKQQQGEPVKREAKPLPQVADDVRARITDARVTVMSDGQSRYVTAKIDGEQQGKRVSNDLTYSFLKGIGSITNEERAERAMQVAAATFKDILEAPKQQQEQSQGMKR